MSVASVVDYLSRLPANTHLWLTEVGALRKYGAAQTPVTLDGQMVDDTLQEAQVRFLLTFIAGARTSGGQMADRVYYYALKGDSVWDSALLDGTTEARRPAWYTFCSYTFSSECT